MDRMDMQRLLTASGYYKGRIDGAFGKQTIDAARSIIDRHRDKLVEDPIAWSADRVVIAACQLILLYAKQAPGAIDGLLGHNTINAFDAWERVLTTGKAQDAPRTPVKGYVPVKGRFPNQAGMPAFYGKPGLPGSKEDLAMQAKLVSFKLPFAFRLDYDRDQAVNSIRFHQLCVDSAEEAYKQAIAHYGEAEFKRLELDCFGGSYMPRKMRGSNAWSVHAFGAAGDTSAARNGLHTKAPEAQFSGEAYKAWFDIWEAQGWTSLGRAIDRDWMHIQAGSIR